jgi:Cd2+/Zn2+-exporting ATPase
LPVVLSAVKGLYKREISMDMLASVALVFSLVSKEWLSASFIAMMIAAARILQSVTEYQAERNIKSLFKLRPEKAKIIKNNDIKEIAVNQLKVGDIIVVDLGERVPIDGKVVAGSFSVDESSLTGESMPVDKGVGSLVWSPSIVVSGSAHIEVEKIGKDTTLEKIIALLQSSSELKPRFQTLGERFGKIYLIGIFAVSFLTLFITHDTKLVLSIILVICADDVAVAVPLAYLSATRRAAKIGAIVKGSVYLEALSDIHTIAFDKTGTLTSGHMKVDRIKSYSKYTESELLGFCGPLSEQSTHPISKAIYKYAKLEKIHFEIAQDVAETGGMGLSGKCRGKPILFGRKTFMESNKININHEVQQDVLNLEDRGVNVSFVAVDNELSGIISLTDEVRHDAKVAIGNLKKMGVKNIVMLTGDNERVARMVAEAVGISEFRAGLLPGQKVDYIKSCIDKNKTVAMVGDGVNDAAALRIATVGIAMGAIGYDTAIESADIVLMRDNISKIPEIMKLSRFTRRLSKEDFWIWGFSNVLGLFLVFGKVIGPSGAAAYNFLTDFLPLGNSLRSNKK